MKFNISYFGPEPLFHLRRDFILAMKYGLEDLGHDVILSGVSLESNRFNLIVGAYFLKPLDIPKIAQSGVAFAHVNTEVIAQDMLNFNPEKTDFMGAYLPSLKAGQFVWDVIMDNLPEYKRYQTRSYFMRWGWHPRLEDIEQKTEKDLDIYFFGMMSKRRQDIVQSIIKRGFRGAVDHSCPYFLRNDRIARSKIQLNIVQEEKYTHVNSFRICYLANNRCAILSERETDPANYLDLARITDAAHFADAVEDLVAGNKWRQLGEESYEKFRAAPMRDCMEKLLDASFGHA